MRRHQSKVYREKDRGARRGFTLVELLVVIAIIAILAAILFPVFAQAKVSAKQTGEVTGLRQLGMAFDMYRQDYDGGYVPLYWIGPPGQTKPDNYGIFRWPWILSDYTSSLDIFFSPADAEGLHFRNQRATDPYWGYLFGLVPSWGYNSLTFSPPGLEQGTFAPIRDSAVEDPSGTLLLASSYWGTDSRSLRTGYYRLYPPSQWAGVPPLNGLSYGHVWPRFRNRFAAVLFADGHAKLLSIEQIAEEEIWTAEREN
ncbi:MAG: hypothetical protein KatS3mg015_0521 [Fimbriimonadales bacterium]|nr:MAG: hypothetical protein KatS3mg015_0521 [Fimbriimonadales bacterium]